MTELLSCPFCGEKPFERWEDNINGPQYPGHYFVWCENLDCGAGGEAMEETKEAAYKAWNTRSPSERPVAQVREALPVVSIKRMRLSDGRTDYFVSIRVDDREVTPHVFREEYKAAYHVALYAWLLNGTSEKPRVVECGPDDWPALTAERPEAAVAMIERSEFEIVRKASRLFEDAANAWMERALKAEAALAIQHEEPGRETMTSVPQGAKRDDVG